MKNQGFRFFSLSQTFTISNFLTNTLEVRDSGCWLSVLFLCQGHNQNLAKQTSKIELYRKIVNCKKPFIIFSKCSIWDVWLRTKYPSTFFLIFFQKKIALLTSALITSPMVFFYFNDLSSKILWVNKGK